MKTNYTEMYKSGMKFVILLKLLLIKVGPNTENTFEWQQVSETINPMFWSL